MCYPATSYSRWGGVDLRNNCIGVEEWADMVHFVRHVGRPLEMVMARDKAFVAPMPPAGAATTETTETTTGTSNGKMMIADDDAREETEEVKVEEDGGMEAEEVDARTMLGGGAGGGGMFDDVIRFSLRADEICNLPAPRVEVVVTAIRTTMTTKTGGRGESSCAGSR